MKWILGACLFTVALSVFLVFRYGLAPKSLRVIKPTYFEEKEEIGGVLFRRHFSRDEKGGWPLC